MTKETTFFSYSRSDSDFVLKLAKDLRDAGAELWLDQLDIKAGSHWDASIEAALNSASRLIVILSPASVGSNNVMDEVSFALESGKSVIPVLISECTTPFRLRRVQRIDFTGDYQTGLNQLLELLGYNAGNNVKTGEVNKEPVLPGTVFTVPTPVAEQKNKEEADNKLWEEANMINSVSSYKKYLNENVSGLHKEKAQQLISKLETEQKDNELEKLIWEKAKAKNTLTAFKHYLDEYPKGIYKPDALTAINKLEENEKPEQVKPAQEEKPLLEKTGKSNTSKKYLIAGISVITLVLIIWGINSYYTANSRNELVKKADSVTNIIPPIDDSIVNNSQNRITKLNTDSLIKDSLASVENKVWKHTQEQNTIEAFQAYLSRYPKGKHISQANEKIDLIKKEQIRIGKKYEGGIIFYVDASGKHGLLAAPGDQGKAIWDAGNKVIYDTANKKTYTTAKKIGSGKENTKMLIAISGTGKSAAKLCSDYSLNGNDDWYLPSLDELNEIYKNIGPGAAAPNKNIGGFTKDFYWSSTQFDINQANTIDFIKGYRYNLSKQKLYSVRAIRAF